MIHQKGFYQEEKQKAKIKKIKISLLMLKQLKRTLLRIQIKLNKWNINYLLTFRFNIACLIKIIDFRLINKKSRIAWLIKILCKVNK